jgi:hypothetical protein
MITIVKNNQLEMYKLGNRFFIVENDGTCIFASSSQVKVKNFFYKTSYSRGL